MTTARRTCPLVLGAMVFGTLLDDDASFALLDRFVERGGVWIDTADNYAFWLSASGHGGDSERVLGRWIAARPGIRERIRLSTKLGAEPSWPGSFPAQRSGLSARAVQSSFAGSLERLGVDAVDMLWLHMEDRTTPIEQTVDALAGLTATGAVRRVGASNHPAWRVERARARAAEIGSVPIDAFQLNSTYLRVRPETLPPGVSHRFGLYDNEQRDYAAEHGIEVWAYTPLLSGAYDNPDKKIADEYDHPGTSRRLAVLDEVAAETGAARGQVVLAWLVAHGIRPILGGSRMHQLDSALEAMQLELTPEQVARMDAPA